MQQPLLTIEQAVDFLKAGKVIAYPTEAVYGLGCDPANERAVRRILSMKGRSATAGLILIADSFDRFSSYVQAVAQEKLSVALASWPGPITWLFPRAPGVPDFLAGRHTAIALRVTAHPVSRSLCSAFGGAIVSTSANPSGAPPAKSPREVMRYFGDQLSGVVRGPLGGDSKPSEIRDLATGKVIRGG